jgi:hypothetical protein
MLMQLGDVLVDGCDVLSVDVDNVQLPPSLRPAAQHQLAGLSKAVHQTKKQCCGSGSGSGSSSSSKSGNTTLLLRRYCLEVTRIQRHFILM